MVVSYRAKTDDPWTVLTCRLSGRFQFDEYEAHYRARDLVRQGAAEAQVMRGDVVVGRFYRTATGEAAQEGDFTL